MHPFLLGDATEGAAAAPPPPKKKARTGLELHTVQLGSFPRPPVPRRVTIAASVTATLPPTATLGIQPLLQALMLQPRVSQLAMSAPEPYPVHTTTVTPEAVTVTMPRFFGTTLFPQAEPMPELLAEVAAPHLAFAGTLMPRQEAAVQAALDAYTPHGGAMLELPCGFGKTVIALALAARLRVRTLVVVHKEFLMDQWKERLQQFIPTARVGRVQQNVVQVEALSLATSSALELVAVKGVGPKLAERIVRERPATLADLTGISATVRTNLAAALAQPGYDVVLGMLHSLSSREYAGLETCGLVIVDEAHHICAATFSRAMRRLPAARILGLSATPKRPDGLGFALPWFLGPVRYRAERTYDCAEVQRHLYLPPEAQQQEIFCRNKVLLPAMVTRMLKDFRRNGLLLRLIRETMAEGRHLIVLSERLSLLERLRQLLTGKYELGMYVGGMSVEEREASAGKPLVLATYSMCAEGLDIPRLDTLLLATPRTNVEQSVGRILRAHPAKAQPRVLDVVDEYSVFQGMAQRRLQLYRKHSFEVQAIRAPEQGSGV